MSSTEIIFNDKLSLELFREGKRPVDKASEATGLLFINTNNVMVLPMARV